MQTSAIYDHTNHATIPTTKTKERNSFMWYEHYVFISALSVLTNKRYGDPVYRPSTHPSIQ